MIVIMGCFLWTTILILRVRNAAAVAKGFRSIARRHVISSLKLLGIIAVVLGVIFFKTLYIGRMCAD